MTFFALFSWINLSFWFLEAWIVGERKDAGDNPWHHEDDTEDREHKKQAERSYGTNKGNFERERETRLYVYFMFLCDFSILS